MCDRVKRSYFSPCLFRWIKFYDPKVSKSGEKIPKIIPWETNWNQRPDSSISTKNVEK